MNPVWRRLTSATTTIDDPAAYQPEDQWQVVAVQPPRGSVPATITPILQTLHTKRSGWFGVRNQSPTVVFELYRTSPEQVTVQFAVPTTRLERTLRTQLARHIDGISFTDGVSGLPVSEGITVGGALGTLRRQDWYPLQTRFDQSPMDTVVTALHRHAMRDTRMVLQVLAQPVAGHPVREWWWNRRAGKERTYLRKEKEHLWGNRRATTRERDKAKQLDAKRSGTHWRCSIRLLAIGAGEHTTSRVGEVGSTFAVYENAETSQALHAVPVRALREKRLRGFVRAVGQRRFGQWSRRFRATHGELGGLMAVPSSDHEHITTASP